MGQVKKAPCDHNLEGPVKTEECLEQILLSPEPAIFENPALRILGGEENVVTVNDDTGLKRGMRSRYT